MRLEARVLGGASAFLGGACLIYWFTSYEDAGTMMLLFSWGAYAILCGFMLLQWRRRKGVPRPEDRVDATYSDGSGAVGYFPAASMWPAGAGIGFVFLGVGFVFGVWYWIIGGIFFLGAVIGWVVESEAPDVYFDAPHDIVGSHNPRGDAILASAEHDHGSVGAAEQRPGEQGGRVVARSPAGLQPDEGAQTSEG